MNTTEFIQAVENHKVLTNEKEELIVKDDDGKIWFFGFGMTAHANRILPSDMFPEQVVFAKDIRIIDQDIPFPTFAVACDKWKVRE